MKKMRVKTIVVLCYILLIAMIVMSNAYMGVALFQAGKIGMFNVLLVFAAIQVVICVFSIIVVDSFVAKPMDNMRKNLQLMNLGDLEAVNMQKKRDDEIGEAIDYINELAQTSKKEAEIAHQIAQGILTMDVTPRSDKDILGKAIAELVRDNNEVLGNIRESTEQVTAGAEQVADASTALAQGSTEQASAIEQITASLDEIAQKTKNNASLAGSAAQLVHEMKSASESGKTHMDAMMDAMNEINNASESISKVIKVIDDIAFQTNLLALNATVEAARAGVHGKGFAVVAEEVRNLAEKSAAAANETGEMIQDSIRKVHKGAEYAKDTAVALDGISVSIVKTVELIDNIANASNEQATAVTQIDQAISQVSEVVQTNSATSEECASASEELSNQAENLRDMMSKYQLKKMKYNSDTYASKKNDTQYSGSRNRDNSNNERIISLDGDFGKY